MNQQKLIDSIEKLGVYVSKHPTGTVIATYRGERVFIFPHEKSWSYSVYEGRDVNPRETGFYLRDEVRDFAEFLNIWKLRLG